MKVNYNQSGVTLVELMICLAIIGIICCVALPLTPKLYKQNQSQVIEDQIRYAIRLAKMQAIIRGERLILTHRNDTLDWSSGMALYVEKSSHKKLPEHGQLLHEWQWPKSLVSVEWKGFQSKNYLRFEPELSHSAINGVFYIAVGNEPLKKLVINRIGRVSLALSDKIL